MLGIHHYWLFIATAIVLVITPGQDTFFILGRSLSGGRSAGIAAALGITAGSVIHTFAAALGLSALLATSPYAFMAVKFAGAAYLIYIGVRALLSRANGLPGDEARTRARWPLAGVSPGHLFEPAESQGGAVLPRAHAAVHRGRQHQQGGRVPRAGPHVRGAGRGLVRGAGRGRGQLRGAFLRRPSMATCSTRSPAPCSSRWD